MTQLLSSGSLLLALLNPFLLIVYLIDIVERLDARQFHSVLLRAGLIASGVLCAFAVLGDAVFSRVIQAEFASFQIFGGIIFVMIGLRFVFQGPTAIEILRGESQHLAGAVAMPILIGPGTISASVIIGERHNPIVACAVVLAAVLTSILIILVLKAAHDVVRMHREVLVRRYIEIMGRITALYVGTVAIEMMMQGLQSWIEEF